MNKKGFTIPELLGIVVILSIILVIAVPKINNILNESKTNAFLVEAQSVYRTAKIKAVDLANTDGGGIISSKDSTKLDMKGNQLDYCIIVDSKANITSITVSNGKYIIRGGTDFLTLDSSFVTNGNMNDYICE